MTTLCPSFHTVNVSEHSERLSQRCQSFPKYLRGEALLYAGVLGAGADESESKPWRRPTVGIIGTRSPTSYGLRFVQSFVDAFAPLGWNLVSGGAFGIDAEMHASALRAGVSNQAWVVGPLARPSPRAHRNLFEALCRRPGCGVWVPKVLEPRPGEAHQKSDWIERNQWLAAACDALIVVEARYRSGTWSTVKMGQKWGLSTYAVPGPITREQSQGTNRMIARGYAHPVEGVSDLIETLVVEFKGSSYNRNRSLKGFAAPAEGLKGRGSGSSKREASDYSNWPNLLSEMLERPGGVGFGQIPVLAREWGVEWGELSKLLRDWAQAGDLFCVGDRFERRGKRYES